MNNPNIAKGIVDLYTQWLDNKAAEDQAKELSPDRLGKLRGGSVGMINPKGLIFGTCPRRALARSWGFNPRPDDDKRIMFEQGKANEGFWDEVFTSILGEDKLIPEGHKDSVVSWQTPDSRVVEGSPDAVLKEFMDQSKVLLEYKRISSVWTARKVSIKKFPKKAHIIQAAHYMGVSNIARGAIIYKQDVDFATPPIGRTDITALWPESSPVVEYDKDFPRRLKGHISVFDLMWDGNSRLWFRHHTEEDWRPTDITLQSIHAWYCHTSQQERDRFLSKKPTRNSPVGDSKDNESPCTYCELAGICEDKSLTYDSFEEQVKELIPSNK